MIDPKGSRDMSTAMDLIRFHRSQHPVATAVIFKIQRGRNVEPDDTHEQMERALKMDKQ